MGRHFLREIIPQLEVLPQLYEAGRADGTADLAVRRAEVGRSSAEGTFATVLSLQALVWATHRLSRLSAVVRAGPRGLQEPQWCLC